MSGGKRDVPGRASRRAVTGTTRGRAAAGDAALERRSNASARGVRDDRRGILSRARCERSNARADVCRVVVFVPKQGEPAFLVS